MVSKKEKITILIKKDTGKLLREIKENKGTPMGSSLENAFEAQLKKVTK